MLKASEFNILLANLGQDVTVDAAKTRAKTTSKAIVQSTSKAQDTIVQAYGVTGKSFQFPASSPVARLDQIALATGERFTVDAVVDHHDRATGQITSRTAYCKGK